MTKWIRSFRFAYSGIKYALATQRNMKFHFSAAFVALLSALFFQLEKWDILFLLLAITLVIVMELINTAIEKAVDLAMPGIHPLAKIAKDVAAAAVLVSAVFAAIVGAVIFYGPLERWIRGAIDEPARLSSSAVWLYLALVAFTMIVVETRFSAKSGLRPSLWMALSFSLSTLIFLISLQPLVSILAYSLSFLFMFVLYVRKTRTWPALLLGGVIGVVVTILAFWLHALL